MTSLQIVLSQECPLKSLDNFMPIVSIITPAYNCMNTIKKCVNSVLSQTFRDFEWIIIDDFSTDGSIDYFKFLLKKDGRIKIILNGKNLGSAAARNKGLKEAKGRYITFLDSDDILDVNYLEEQVKFIVDNGPLISAGYRRQAEHTCTNFYVPDETDYKKALRGNPLSCLTTMYDKSVIGDLYFDETYNRHEDYIFWLTLLKRGIVAKGNHNVLATYVIHPNSKNSNKSKLVKSMYRVYHESQEFNWLKSWIYVFRYALYSKKKYKGVK